MLLWIFLGQNVLPLNRMYVQYLFHTISILVSYRGRYPGVAAMIAEENYFTFIHIPASCHKQYLQNASYNLIDGLVNKHVGHFFSER